MGRSCAKLGVEWPTTRRREPRYGANRRVQAASQRHSEAVERLGRQHVQALEAHAAELDGLRATHAAEMEAQRAGHEVRAAQMLQTSLDRSNVFQSVCLSKRLSFKAFERSAALCCALLRSILGIGSSALGVWRPRWTRSERGAPTPTPSRATRVPIDRCKAPFGRSSALQHSILRIGSSALEM